MRRNLGLIYDKDTPGRLVNCDAQDAVGTGGDERVERRGQSERVREWEVGKEEG